MPVALVSVEQSELDELPQRTHERLAAGAQRVSEVRRPSWRPRERSQYGDRPAMVEEPWKP